jgi:hypothetical protein
VRRPVVVASPAPVAKDPGERARDLVDLETEWLQLTRGVTEARQRRDQIEAQLFRADIRAGSEAVGHGVQVSVLDPAFLPDRPLPPGKTTPGLIFAGISLTLGLLAVALLALIDERIFRARDATDVAEVLVEVPKLVGATGGIPRRAHVAS